jgi:hypothetical protein
VLQPRAQHRRDPDAPHDRLLDPFGRKEGLGEIPLGRRLTWRRKPKGTIRMTSKRERNRRRVGRVPQDPRDMEKPTLADLSLQRWKLPIPRRNHASEAGPPRCGDVE